MAREALFHFVPQPTDLVWKSITEENVAAYQLWFQRMLLGANLAQLQSSDKLTDAADDVLAEIARNAFDEHGLTPVILLVLAHQFADADVVMRGLHTTTWVAKMVSRENYAPSPETYAEYIKGRFFFRPST